MQIDRQEMLRRLNSNKNLARQFCVSGKAPICPEPDAVVPKREREREPSKEVKIVIGSLARQGVSPEIVAQEFGVTVKQVKQSAESPDPQVAQGVNSSVDRIRELAMDKMLIALGLMTPDKFMDVPLKDLTAATANLSRVIESTTPKETSDKSRIQFVIYAPQQREERDYKVIDV